MWKRALVAMAIMGVCLVACKRSSHHNNLNELISWDIVEVTKVYVDPAIENTWEGSGELPSCKVSVRMAYPTILDNNYRAIGDSLVKLLAHRLSPAEFGGYTKEEVLTFLNEYIDEQVSDYKLDLEQAKNLNFDVASMSIFNREYEYKDSIAYNSHDIVSIVSSEREYSGGVHANEWVSTLNYDLDNNSVITAGSLFKDATETELTDLLLGVLRDHFNVTSNKELEYQGVFNYQALEVTSNFYFDEKGVTFYYNPYQLASYAVGPIRLHLSYDEVAPYLSSAYRF